MTLQLVLPSAKYKKSFLEAQKEQVSYPGTLFSARETRQISEEEFEKFLKKKEDERQGRNLKNEYVPATTLWFVEGDKWLGEINIRHKSTPHLLHLGGHIGYALRPSARGKGFGTKMLELALPKAKELGFEKVLITCDNENIASARVIEKNGGVLENIVEREDEELEGIPAGKTRRYWITVK